VRRGVAGDMHVGIADDMRDVKFTVDMRVKGGVGDVRRLQVTCASQGLLVTCESRGYWQHARRWLSGGCASLTYW
jgi:hypothetical protein